MKKFLLISICLCACLSAPTQTRTRYVGGDISLLPQYEKHNSGYKDVNGQKINDMLTWFVQDCGWNTFRVRIFVNPGTSDPSVCQDLTYVTALGKRIKDAGAYFLLDFHYSDTWVDATHIQAPKAWQGANDAAMADSVAAYTRSTLQTLIAAGAKPDLVQVGNEIMYGLCGIKVAPYARSGDNWQGYLGLLKAGCNAVRELCPDANIIIHTDRPTNKNYNRYYYQQLVDNGVDFDVIGLSYYPFWHGYMTEQQVSSKSNKDNLESAVKQLAVDFPDKRVHIVECAYNFQYWPSEGVNYDTQKEWPCSVQGQYNFVRDLVNTLYPIDHVDGINYWFPEEAGNGDDTNWNTSKGTVLTSWLNRGFWNENQTNNGHAINKTGTATDGRTAADVCAPYYMGKFLTGGLQAIETIEGEGLKAKGEKVLENGQVVIRRNGRTFTLLGSEL